MESEKNPQFLSPLKKKLWIPILQLKKRERNYTRNTFILISTGVTSVLTILACEQKSVLFSIIALKKDLI